MTLLNAPEYDSRRDTRNRNLLISAGVLVALLVGALSVAGAIFLILELSEPYHGLMRISDEPLRNAMAQIDQ